MGEVRKLIEDPTFPNGWPVKETHIDHQLKWKDGVSKEYGVHGSAVGVDFDICIAVTLPITYLIVDRIIDNNEKKKLGPIEKLAKERLRSKLGVGFLTTFLITLVIDITSASREKSPIPKDVLLLHIEKLKTAQ